MLVVAQGRGRRRGGGEAVERVVAVVADVVLVVELVLRSPQLRQLLALLRRVDQTVSCKANQHF